MPSLAPLSDPALPRTKPHKNQMLTIGAGRGLLMALTLAAFAWRLAGLSVQSLWRDEIDAIYFAVRDLPDTLAMFVQAAQNGPLFFLSLRPWLHAVGSSEFALRFPSVCASALCIPLTWQVARRLLPAQAPHAALLAATFMAVNPYQLWYGQEGKMYSAVSALALLATWCWLVGMERGGWRPWLGYAICVSLAIYTHLLMILIIPLHLLWAVIAWPQSKVHWRGYGLALAGLTLPYTPMIWWQWGMLTTQAKSTGFSFTPLRTILVTLLHNHSRGIARDTALPWFAPVYFVAAAGLLLGFTVLNSKEECSSAGLSATRRFGLIVSWLLAPIVLLYLISLRQPVFTDRYLIWIAPAAMLTLAIGIEVLRDVLGKAATPLAIVLSIYIIGLWLFIGGQQRTLPLKYDLRGAVTYIAQRRTPDTLLILQIPYMEYAYRYYSSNFGPQPFADSDRRLGHWAGGLWTNDGAGDDQARTAVDVQMRELTAGSNEVWLLLSEADMWDQRRLMDEWLKQHGTLEEVADFPGAQVLKFHLSAP